MAIKPIQYETLLSTCTDHIGALDLLRRHRPYMEVVPSMRRPEESIVSLPLPNVRVRNAAHLEAGGSTLEAGAVVNLPCDVALLMCDPEWKIKTGIEIFVYIHRPQEDFSQLLMRWRRTQLLLDQGYEWLLPEAHNHLLNDGAEVGRPLFVLFPQSPPHILKGLQGAALPTVTAPFETDPILVPEPTLDLDLDAIDELRDIDTSGLELPDGDEP